MEIRNFEFEPNIWYQGLQWLRHNSIINWNVHILTRIEIIGKIFVSRLLKNWAMLVAQFEILIGKPNLYKFSFLHNEARIFKTLAIFSNDNGTEKWVCYDYSILLFMAWKNSKQRIRFIRLVIALTFFMASNVSIIISSLSRSHPDWGEEFVTAKKVN